MSTLIEKANEILQDKETNLLSENLKQGVTCMGVMGKYSVVDTADADVTAGDILNGKTAYVNGQKIVGNFDPTEQGYYDLSQLGESVAVYAEEKLNVGDFFEGLPKTSHITKTRIPSAVQSTSSDYMVIRAFSSDYSVGVPYLNVGSSNTKINGRVPIYIYDSISKSYITIEATNVSGATYEKYVMVNKEGTLALVKQTNQQSAILIEIDKENRTANGYSFSYYKDGERFIQNGNFLWGDYLLCDRYDGYYVTSTQEGLLKWDKETHTYKHFTYTGTTLGIMVPDDKSNRRILMSSGNVKTLLYLMNTTYSGQAVIYCEIEKITIDESNETYDVTITRLNDITTTKNGSICFSPDGNYILALTDTSANGGQLNIYSFNKNTLEVSLYNSYNLSEFGVDITNASHGVIYERNVLVIDKYIFYMGGTNPYLWFTDDRVIEVDAPQWTASVGRFYAANPAFSKHGYFYNYPTLYGPSYQAHLAGSTLLDGNIYGIVSSDLPVGTSGNVQKLFHT